MRNARRDSIGGDYVVDQRTSTDTHRRTGPGELDQAAHD